MYFLIHILSHSLPCSEESVTQSETVQVGDFRTLTRMVYSSLLSRPFSWATGERINSKVTNQAE